MNYSLPFGAPIGPSGPNWSTLASGFQPAVQHANAVNGLIYDPAAHQQVHPPLAPEFYPNNPYAPPPPLRQPQFTPNNNYLPPHPSPQTHPNRASTTTTTSKHNGYPLSTQPHPQFPTTRTYGENSYSRPSSTNGGGNNNQQQGTQYFNAENPFINQNSNNNKNNRGNSNGSSSSSTSTKNQRPSSTPTRKRPASDTKVNTSKNNNNNNSRQTSNNNNNNSNQNTKQTVGSNKGSSSTGPIPERPGGYVKVQAGTGQLTQQVAVLDYDEEDEDEYYYDDENGEYIVLKFNGSSLSLSLCNLYILNKYTLRGFINLQ